MGIGEAKSHAAALAALRTDVDHLSPSCAVIGGERGVVLKAVLAQLHQSARRQAAGKQPLPVTVGIARRFYVRLNDFWVGDCASGAVSCELPLHWVCERLLDDGHSFLQECGRRPCELVNPELRAIFTADLEILQRLAHAPWRAWLPLVDIRWQEYHKSTEQRGDAVGDISTDPTQLRQRLVRRLLGSECWVELIEEIADYRYAHANADLGPVYVLGRRGEELLKPIPKFAHFPLEWLQGNSRRVDIVEQNTNRLLEGHPANNVLIWGPRGCGKSSLIRGLIGKYCDRGLRGVEINPDAYERIPELFSAIRNRGQYYVGVLDNISVSNRDPEVHTLARVLDGCLEAKPDNLVFYATSNFKDLVDRRANESRDWDPCRWR